jgi:ribA/ribD-fused uncharacterized protein
MIYFYDRDKPYYELTNFYGPAPIVIQGKRWPSVEHFFQAIKFMPAEPLLSERVRALPAPREALQFSREHGAHVRSDWAQIKNDVMLEAVRAKFIQHPHLGLLLAATGTATLVEHTSNDSYWGDGGDGSGRNQLGLTLMRVRSELQ